MEGPQISINRKAALDLSTKQYYAVRLDETSGQIKLANATSAIAGVLQNDPATSQGGNIGVTGESIAAVTGAINVMDRLASDDNGLLVVTTTDLDEYVAWSLAIGPGAGESAQISVMLVGPTPLSAA